MANRILGRSGPFWAEEDFDHWIRTPDKFESTVRYIVNNPVKAGRVRHWSEWKWFLVHEEVRYCMDE
jgi:REP element-mobilizing transposase RayT